MLRVDRIPATARVSMGLGAVFVGAVLLAGCSETTHEPLTVEVAKITIEAGQRSIREGATAQLVAKVQSRYGYDLERGVTWSSSNPELAIVDANGLVTGVHGGWPEITAMAEGMRASILMTVEEYPATLEVAQVPAMEIGDKVRPVATVRCGQGHPMDVPLQWTTANPQVAQVDPNGQILAVGPGQVTITAQGAGFSETISVSVKEPAAWLMLNVPSLRLRIGDEVQVEAVPRGGAMNVLNRPITWLSSDPGVLSVTGDGTIKAIASGPATITAMADGAVGVLGITVEDAVGLVWVTWAEAPVRPNSTVQFGAQTRTAAGALLLGRDVSWSTSNPSIGTMDANGKLATHAPGTFAVYAESEGVVTTTMLTVEGWIATLEIDPDKLLLSQGMMAQFMVTARDAFGNIVHPIYSWTSSDPTVLPIGKTGGVAAYEPGESIVTASSEGMSISVAVKVIPVEKQVLCDRVELDVHSIELSVGEEILLTATAYDADDNEIVRPLEWTSSNETLVTVDDGLVTAVARKPDLPDPTITVTCDGATDEATVKVVAKRGPATWIQVKEIMVVFVGQGAKVEAIAYDKYGPMSVTPTLHTTTPDVLKIVDGQIVGLAPGAGWVWVCCDDLAVPIRVIVKGKDMAGDG